MAGELTGQRATIKIDPARHAGGLVDMDADRAVCLLLQAAQWPVLPGERCSEHRAGHEGDDERERDERRDFVAVEER